MALSFSEFLGYFASVLVFMTFYMRTMVALRCVAIASNVAFVSYAYYEGLLPILILHGLLLPMNLYRLSQLWRLISDSARLRESGFPLEPLIPFMTERKVHPGEVLFRKGEHSRGMYYIAKGRIRIPEVNVHLGPGDILGEISLFTPEKARTASAISERDGIVYWLSEASVLQIFHQNPRFGFSVVRAITARLIDDCRRLQRGELDPERPSAPEGATSDLTLRASTASRELKASQAETTIRKATRRRRLRRVAVIAAPVALLLATVYNGQTYLASVLFRDAVVTSWVHTATSPISGEVQGPVPEPGDVYSAVRAPVLTVRNPQADDTRIQRLAAEMERTRDRIDQLKSQLAEMRATSERWNERTTIYAGVFRDNVQLELSGLRKQLEYVKRQLKLSERVAGRVQRLAQSGNMAPSTADERQARIMALRSRKSELEKRLEHAKRRWEAAKHGVFITADGNNPDWVFDSSDQLALRIIETRDAIAEAESRLETLRKKHRAAQMHYARMSQAGITIPTGSLIWSVPAGPGTTVGRATPLLSWIDCSRPLVDVPVADSSLGLFRDGMEARVYVDGLTQPLAGLVVYTRGAAAPLNTTDLAAVSDSSGQSSGQVIVALDPPESGTTDCLVGRSAYVDFPAVDSLEQLRAFLRL